MPVYRELLDEFMTTYIVLERLPKLGLAAKDAGIPADLPVSKRVRQKDRQVALCTWIEEMGELRLDSV